MSEQNRTTLKGYFETGDVPTQAQFIDLIDSFSTVSEVATVAGNLSALDATVQAIDDLTGAEIKALYEAEDDTNAFTDAEQAKLEALPSDVDVFEVAASLWIVSNDSDPAELEGIGNASALIRAATGFSNLSVTGTGEKDIAVTAATNAIVITPVAGNITIDDVTGLTYHNQSIGVFLVQDTSDRTVTLAVGTNAVLADADALDIPSGSGSRGRALLVADYGAGGTIVPTFYKVNGPT